MDAIGDFGARAVGKLLFGAPLNILMYHGVVETPPALFDWCFLDVDRFAAQMAWLAAQPVEVRPLGEAVSDLRAGRLRRPTVALTFDDGYRNNVEVALPVLARHGLPATIFLTTGFVGGAKALWASRVALAVDASERARLTWRGHGYALATAAERAATSAALQEVIKARAGGDPGAAVGELEAALGVPIDPDVPRHSPFAPMDAADIAAARASGLVDFGAHTVTHPILAQLEDGALAAEIDGSVRAVAELTGEPCRAFAYPNGRPVDWDERAVARLAQAGVTAAVSTVQRPNWPTADPLRLARWGVGADMSLRRFRATVHNVHPAALRALPARAGSAAG